MKKSKSISQVEKKRTEEDIYAFDEVDENEAGGRRKKRKVLKIKKIRSKKGNTQENLISKAERKVLLNAHIKHRKTLTNSEKMEMEDDDRKAKENKKSKQKLRKNQDVPVVKRTRRKVLSDKNENVQKELPKPRNSSTPSWHINPFIPDVFDKITPNKNTSLHQCAFSPASLQSCSPIPGSCAKPTISSTPKYTPCILEPILDPVLSDKSHSTPLHYSLEASVGNHFSDITPVKYHEEETCTTVLIDPKQFNTSNCFGFDEPENSLSETLDYTVRNEPEVIVNKNVNNDKMTVPPKEVIKRLRFELNEPDTTIEQSNNEEMQESMTASRIPDDSSVSEFEEHPKIVFDPKQYAEESNVIKLPRRSYERQMRPRRKKIIICGKIEHDDEELSEDEEEEEKKKPKPYKKKGGKTQGKQNEKQDPAMEKWIKEFNSQCQQIDKFDLCVE